LNARPLDALDRSCAHEQPRSFEHEISDLHPIETCMPRAQWSSAFVVSVLTFVPCLLWQAWVWHRLLGWFLPQADRRVEVDRLWRGLFDDEPPCPGRDAAPIVCRSLRHELSLRLGETDEDHGGEL
jgi:hypothetical protein